ncbi:MAG TPA: hypothetical protein VFG62_19450 [Rhodopila sp.]|jgi:transposase|nr:hypothetical protein [Rhodopila sp.]
MAYRKFVSAETVARQTKRALEMRALGMTNATIARTFRISKSTVGRRFHPMIKAGEIEPAVRGAKIKITDARLPEVMALVREGLTLKVVAKCIGVSIPTIYMAIHRARELGIGEPDAPRKVPDVRVPPSSTQAPFDIHAHIKELHRKKRWGLDHIVEDVRRRGYPMSVTQVRECLYGSRT